MWYTLVLVGLLAGSAAVGGCDSHRAVGPTAVSMPVPVPEMNYEENYPIFRDISEVPDSWYPRVIRTSPVVYWAGREAVASSRMDYFGNRADEDFDLIISGSRNLSRSERSSSGGFLPRDRQHTTPGFRIYADRTCGHDAQLHSRHTARTLFLIEYRGLTELTPHSVPGSADAVQPECTCGGNAMNAPGDPADGDRDAFRPNYEENPTPGCPGVGDGEGGGGGGGGGTLVCVTIYVDHYWWYPDTRTYEYRFTETIHHCYNEME
jgi:hypothetical protein